jgi:prevent-host-death family protein
MAVVLRTTEMRERLGTILDRIVSQGGPVFITRRGRTQAVLLSAAEYESLMRQHEAVSEEGWYAISQASLAQVWEHPDEDVYTIADGVPA